MDAEARACRDHRERFGTEPELVARAPGRVNLIGEHTDYNDGFVLPFAIQHDTVIAASRSGQSTTVALVSEGYGAAKFDVAAPGRLGAGTDGLPRWASYVEGMVLALRERGVTPVGWNGAVATDIPTGASLSSSAALEVSSGLVIAAFSGSELTAVQLAEAGQQVEGRHIGVSGGIMDQLICAAATAGSASLIDCRSLTMTSHHLPDSVAIVVIDTGTRRELVESEYGARRAACVRAAAALDVSSLRDARLEDLDRLDDDLHVERSRAEHVIRENARTIRSAAALDRNDGPELGRLMTASHQSLRDLYEVSGPALDLVVDAAHEAPACLGARMTGGGFAGCAVAAVEAGRVGAFIDAVTDTCGTELPELDVWSSTPSAGASYR